MLRHDFVSNSSSSSFIVISESITDNDKKRTFEDIGQIKKISLPAKHGTYCFGWENIMYNDIWSKLNFCAIQLHDLNGCNKDKKYLSRLPHSYSEFYKKYKFKDCLKLFKDVCKKYLKLEVEVKFEYGDDEKWDYYIDHQSSVREAQNMDMFDSEDTLRRFLISDKSYIQGGNDNDPY